LPTATFALCISKPTIHYVCWYEDDEVTITPLFIIFRFIFELLILIIDYAWINRNIFEGAVPQAHQEQIIDWAEGYLLLWNWQDWYDRRRLLQVERHRYFSHWPDIFLGVDMLHELEYAPDYFHLLILFQQSPFLWEFRWKVHITPLPVSLSEHLDARLLQNTL
jgi:hypothetical protein